MTFIPTILPNDVVATVDIPNYVIGDLLSLILGDIVVETAGRYELSPDAYSGIASTTSIRIIDAYLASVLLMKRRTILLAFYQLDEHDSVNVNLLRLLVTLLHQDPTFRQAITQESIIPPDLELDDIIEFDVTDIPPGFIDDVNSYRATLDILSTLGSRR